MIEPIEFFRQCSVMLVANKLHQDYCSVVEIFGRVEPEEYQELWLGMRIVGDNDHKFRDDVCQVFMTMLQKSGKKNG